MKKILILLSLIPTLLFAVDMEPKDSLKHVYLEEIQIISHKETLPAQPSASYSVLSSNLINQAQVNSVRDLSILVPNFFIPDYGSAMSTAPYIRGVGARSTGQSMALYVDNVPYFEKTTFDFNFYDILQVEVLRGSQSTLYGRNALGGVVNIYTLSPFEYQGTKLSVTGGNYGLLQAQASYYDKLSNKTGLSLSGYYHHRNGFFTNTFTGKDGDWKTSAGGRAKFDWHILPSLRAQYIINYDFVNQNAFPYGLYDATTKSTAEPNFNDKSSYLRDMLTNSLLFEFQNDKIQLTSTTSYQYFSDEMNMDQDFTPLSYFSLEQLQKQHAINEEITLKSRTEGNYQWSFGVTGFYQKLNTDAPVAFKQDALTNILQPVLDRAHTAGAPQMTITSTIMDIPGTYNTKTVEGALYHQSTFNHLFTNGLSASVGIRADFEKVNLNYFTNTSLDLLMKMGNRNIPTTLADTLQGAESVKFSEFLPKVTLKYAWNNQQFVYANVSKGYKAGGYNIQMFSDLIQNDLMNSGNPSAQQPDVRKAILYQPEYSWNYETGFQSAFMDNKLKMQMSLFYMQITDMQLTRFVPSGNGRMITNAGKVDSKGIELSLQANLGKGFAAGINYGYAHATFTNYTDSVQNNGMAQEVDYKGKFVPYAPQNTLNIGCEYLHTFKKSFVDQIMASVQYNGAGKIYWDVDNSIYQNFYGLVNAKVGVGKGNFRVELWAKNLFDTQYNAFYFESFGNKFFQKGNPTQLGLTLKTEF